MVHKTGNKIIGVKRAGIHKTTIHKGTIPMDNPRPDPKKYAYWTLGIKEIGYVYFKHYPSAFGMRMFKKEERPKPRYFCPLHKESELQFRARTYYCPVCKKEYLFEQVVKKFPDAEKGLTSPEIREKYPRTIEALLEGVVPLHLVSPDQLNTQLSYYLVPINTYENMLNYNQLIHMLREGKMVGVTPNMRIVSGVTSHKFVIFPSQTKKVLAMIEYIPERRLVPVPEEAKFKPIMLTPEMKKETVEAEKVLKKIKIEI